MADQQTTNAAAAPQEMPRPEPPRGGPPQRAENLFTATVTYANGVTKRTALDVAGTRRPMTVEQASDYFWNRLGPAGHVVRVQDVRRVTRAEVGRTPPIPIIDGGRQVGSEPVVKPVAAAAPNA
jgi:hypothetical protein